jgi:hypothetical protein
MSMKNSSDTIGNHTRDLPACSAVPQPTAPSRAPLPGLDVQYCVHGMSIPNSLTFCSGVRHPAASNSKDNSDFFNFDLGFVLAF